MRQPQGGDCFQRAAHERYHPGLSPMLTSSFPWANPGMSPMSTTLFIWTDRTRYDAGGSMVDPSPCRKWEHPEVLTFRVHILLSSGPLQTVRSQAVAQTFTCILYRSPQSSCINV
ncbi:hypothetical protein CRG98_010795 [Punica granatum]|uniref:Uncharacterized protein n=1 Tax=Punica granatum TaxID=22663 RepID=A0A2I0KJR2_PUNGR|nr:hypothetical protein CRG98_010795 [Punica granatum]